MARTLRQQQISVSSVGQAFSTPFPDPVVARRAPTTSDTGFDLGQVWVDEPASTAYILTHVGGGIATWVLASSATSDINTINGVAPVVNNIDVLGGTNLTVALGVGTVTLDLDAAIALATSVTSPLYTSLAAMQIAVTAGDDITVKMGDAVGANKVSFVDSAAAEVASIDSNGVITGSDFEGIIGAVAPAAGTFTTSTATTSVVSPIFTAPAATDTEIDAIAGQDIILMMGDAAGANKVSFVDSASAEVFAIDSNGVLSTLTGLTVAGAFAQTAGTFDVGQDNAADAINIGGGTTARAIGIGNSAAPHVLTVGSVDTTAQTIVQSGTVGLSETSTGSITLDSVGVLELNSSAGVIGIGNDVVAQNINVGTGGVRTITVGSNTGATSVVVDVGTGAANFGATATDHATTIGSTIGVSPTTIQSGTGDLILTSTDAILADSVGVLELNSSGAAISIGNDADNFAVNIGTAGTRTVTVGSAAATSSTVIQGGTGGISFVGDITQLNSDFITRTGDQITFQESPIMQSSATTGAAPTGATNDVNLMMLQEGIVMEQFVIGAGQTIIAPRMGATGLLVSGDLTATEGYEYNFGAARLNSRHAFTIGTSAAFMFELRMYINDMDGADPYVFGFRKVEANNATFNNYTDYASIGMIAGTSVTEIVTSTELNAGGNTITNTTDLWGGDAATNTMAVLVDATGNVTYTINGAAPTASAAFQFDNGDVVVPFVRLTHSASPTQVALVSTKVGFQP
jgi:hypothetical protein